LLTANPTQVYMNAQPSENAHAAVEAAVVEARRRARLSGEDGRKGGQGKDGFRKRP
jgi:hypothetical protein